MRKIRIKLNSLHFSNPPVMRGRSDVKVTATANGQALGRPTDRWTVRSREKITFDPAAYSKTIDVEGRTQPLEISVRPQFDEPGNNAIIGGTLLSKIPWPFSPRVFSHSRAQYVAEWEIEPVSVPRPPAPSGIYACREDKSGAVLYTKAARPHQLRVEIHPVLPTPHGTAHDARGPGPARPALNHHFAWEDGDAKTAAELTGGADVNIIENPAVIPILPRGTAADGTNCAKFRVTYYWPSQLAFTADDARLTWSIVSTGGGDAQFFGRKTGRTVSLHGRREGEMHLEVRFENTQVAFYRVLVKPLVIIPFRCTILYGHPNNRDFRPRSTPADVRNHVLVANRMLWQMGLKLEPFDSAAIGWKPRPAPPPRPQPGRPRPPAPLPITITPVQNEAGFFTARVAGIWTRGLPNNLLHAAALNSLPYVFNFAYIKSDAGGNLGLGIYMELGGTDNITDSGTPSTSWIRPSGINPDAGAKSVTMKRMPVADFQKDARFPNRFAMVVTDANADAMNFGGTIAHELGHVLGLNHRVEGNGGYDDLVRYPPRQNVMHYNAGSDVAQDFDIIQAKQVRLSPLVSPPAGGRPAP